MAKATMKRKRNSGIPPNVGKRIKVQAQRKFAQGVAVLPLQVVKDVSKVANAEHSKPSQEKHFNTSTEQHSTSTEDFLTFLCFKGIPAPPDSELHQISTAQLHGFERTLPSDSEAVSRIPNTCSPSTSAQGFIPFGVRKQASQCPARNTNINRTIQALQSKYNRERQAKLCALAFRKSGDIGDQSKRIQTRSCKISKMCKPKIKHSSLSTKYSMIARKQACRLRSLNIDARQHGEKGVSLRNRIVPVSSTVPKALAKPKVVTKVQEIKKVSHKLEMSSLHPRVILEKKAIDSTSNDIETTKKKIKHVHPTKLVNKLKNKIPNIPLRRNHFTRNSNLRNNQNLISSTLSMCQTRSGKIRQLKSFETKKKVFKLNKTPVKQVNEKKNKSASEVTDFSSEDDEPLFKRLDTPTRKNKKISEIKCHLSEDENVKKSMDKEPMYDSLKEPESRVTLRSTRRNTHFKYNSNSDKGNILKRDLVVTRSSNRSSKNSNKTLNNRSSENLMRSKRRVSHKKPSDNNIEKSFSESDEEPLAAKLSETGSKLSRPSRKVKPSQAILRSKHQGLRKRNLSILIDNETRKRADNHKNTEVSKIITPKKPLQEKKSVVVSEPPEPVPGSSGVASTSNAVAVRSTRSARGPPRSVRVPPRSSPIPPQSPRSRVIDIVKQRIAARRPYIPRPIRYVRPFNRTQNEENLVSESFDYIPSAASITRSILRAETRRKFQKSNEYIERWLNSTVQVVPEIPPTEFSTQGYRNVVFPYPGAYPSTAGAATLAEPTEPEPDVSVAVDNGQPSTSNGIQLIDSNEPSTSGIAHYVVDSGNLPLYPTFRTNNECECTESAALPIEGNPIGDSNDISQVGEVKNLPEPVQGEIENIAIESVEVENFNELPERLCVPIENVIPVNIITTTDNLSVPVDVENPIEDVQIPLENHNLPPVNLNILGEIDFKGETMTTDIENNIFAENNAKAENDLIYNTNDAENQNKSAIESLLNDSAKLLQGDQSLNIYEFESDTEMVSSPGNQNSQKSYEDKSWKPKSTKDSRKGKSLMSYNAFKGQNKSNKIEPDDKMPVDNSNKEDSENLENSLDPQTALYLLTGEQVSETYSNGDILPESKENFSNKMPSTSQKTVSTWTNDPNTDAIKSNIDDSEGHLFYIPLDGVSKSGLNMGDHMIQGVAVKLEGHHERVIMRAKLVTKSQVGSVQMNENIPVGPVNDMMRSVLGNIPETATFRNTFKPVEINPTEAQNQSPKTVTPVLKKNPATANTAKKEVPPVNIQCSSKSSTSSSQRSVIYPRRMWCNKIGEVINHSNNTAFPQLDDPAQMVEAPVFRPTEKEFQDPLEFIEKISPVAARYGLCRIIPPGNFKAECKISDDMRFTPHNQYLHRMLYRWGPSSREMCAIKKYLATQRVSFKQPPSLSSVEVDLPKLYHCVQNMGGLKKVLEKKMWSKVAEEMCLPLQLQHNMDVRLDEIYCKYLLPYDTLTSDERKKLFESVDLDWEKRQSRMILRAANPTSSLSEGDTDEPEYDITEDIEECISRGKSMTLCSFSRTAKNIMTMQFGKVQQPTPDEVESKFWQHVTYRKNHVCVSTGSIDSSVWGYGFPNAKTKNSPISKHPWNLKVLTNNSGSVLRSLGPIMGVTVPTLHVGMVFSTCCWYRDPHGLPWIEYLHEGAPKIWYGVPDTQSDKFKQALTSIVPGYCQKKTIWLLSDTAMVPPTVLTEHGVSLCKTVQQPGEYILVFPKAFTSSISTGYNVSESVYFALNTWLDMAQQDFTDIRESCEPSMFSLERLIMAISEDVRSSYIVLKKILPAMNKIVLSEKQNREALFNMGLKSSEKAQLILNGKKKVAKCQDEAEECHTCRTNLSLSMLHNIEDNSVYCLIHGAEYLAANPTQIESCKLVYMNSVEDLERLLSKLIDRINVLANKGRSGKIK